MIANIFATRAQSVLSFGLVYTRQRGRKEGEGKERRHIGRPLIKATARALRSGIPGRRSERRVLPFLGGKIFRGNH